MDLKVKLTFLPSMKISILQLSWLLLQSISIFVEKTAHPYSDVDKFCTFSWAINPKQFSQAALELPGYYFTSFCDSAEYYMPHQVGHQPLKNEESKFYVLMTERFLKSEPTRGRSVVSAEVLIFSVYFLRATFYDSVQIYNLIIWIQEFFVFMLFFMTF